VARAAPSLQIFSVGFTFLIMSGFVTVSLSLRAIAVGFVDHLGTLGGELERLLLSLASG
jgi:flagellar biosynthesis protein FliR